jgi:hypothetical protein
MVMVRIMIHYTHYGGRTDTDTRTDTGSTNLQQHELPAYTQHNTRTSKQQNS